MWLYLISFAFLVLRMGPGTLQVLCDSFKLNTGRKEGREKGGRREEKRQGWKEKERYKHKKKQSRKPWSGRQDAWVSTGLALSRPVPLPVNTRKRQMTPHSGVL